MLCPSCSVGGLAGSAACGPGHRNAFFFAVHLKSGARASYRVQLSLNQALNLKKPLCKNFRGELWNKYIDSSADTAVGLTGSGFAFETRQLVWDFRNVLLPCLLWLCCTAVMCNEAVLSMVVSVSHTAFSAPNVYVFFSLIIGGTHGLLLGCGKQ